MKEWFIVLVMMGVLFILSGCATPCPPAQDTLIETPARILYRTVAKTDWLATVAIVGIAISAFAFLNGSKTGIAGMAACFIALTMTLAVARYATWLAAGGAIGSIGTLVYSIIVKDRALTEVVAGGQLIKSSLAEVLDNGDRARTIVNECQGECQSPTTKKIVAQVKNRLPVYKRHVNSMSCCPTENSCANVMNSFPSVATESHLSCISEEGEN